MKVLHITHDLNHGGASTYVNRVLDSLEGLPFESRIFVGSGKSNYENSSLLYSGGIEPLKRMKSTLAREANKTLVRLEKTRNYQHKSINFFGAIPKKRIYFEKPDLIHLYWINHGLISLKTLSKLKIPIIWSALDMWPLGGGEHYVSDQNIERFRCGYSSESRDSKEFGLDICKLNFNMKSKMILDKLLVINPTYWLQNISKENPLGGMVNSVVIPPPIDLNMYKPKDLELRKLATSITIGFGGGYNQRKGWDSVKKIFIELNEFLDISLIHFGGSTPDQDLISMSNYVFLGHISNSNAELNEILSSLDILLFPSRMEAFGLLAQEAQAAGCPVIVLSNTGSAEIVEHEHTGFVAKNCDEIARFLYDYANSGQDFKLDLRRNSRQRAVKLWDKKLIGNTIHQYYLQLTK